MCKKQNIGRCFKRRKHYKKSRFKKSMMRDYDRRILPWMIETEQVKVERESTMKKCMFLAVTGESPNNDECVRQLANGRCEKCRFYLEELPEPEPGHENDKDELPY